MASKPVRTKKVSLTQDVTVLAVDSNYESVTLAAFNYREKHVYPYLMSKGLSLKKLQGPMARRHYVAPEASKRQAGYLTGVGRYGCGLR